MAQMTKFHHGIPAVSGEEYGRCLPWLAELEGAITVEEYGNRTTRMEKNADYVVGKYLDVSKIMRGYEPPPRSWGERLHVIWSDRIKAAWLVLIGKAWAEEY